MSEEAIVLLADDAPIAELDELRPLIAEGQERGFLTFEQIAGVSRGSRGHQGAAPGAARLSRRPGNRRGRGDGNPIKPGTAVDANDSQSNGNQAEERKKVEIDLTVEPSLDSLRLYLRSIGRVDLLTAEQEVIAGPADRARRHAGQAADDRGQPAARRVDRQGLSGSRPDVPGPDPGGLDGPDPRGREVRLPPRLQVLDVRDLVDPPGGHARDRRQGPDDPDPRAHGREAQQGRPRRAPARPAARARADSGGDRHRARDHRARGPRRPADGPAADLAGEADRRGGGVRAGRLRRGPDRRVAVRARRRAVCGARTFAARWRRCPSASAR